MAGSDVHSLLKAPASPHLREHVRTFAEREVNSPVLEIVQPYPATLDYVLAFDFLGGLPILEYCDGRPGDTYQMALVGPYTSRRANFRLRGIVDSFGIFFQPFGFWRLFGIPKQGVREQRACSRRCPGKADARTMGALSGEQVFQASRRCCRSLSVVRACTSL